MNFIKAGKIITGVKLSPKEQEAMDRAIQKQLAEYDRKNADEIDAMVLWIIHKIYKKGHKELKRFHREFVPEIRALWKRYEMTDKADTPWLCTKMLLDYGIDIHEWNRELEAEYGEGLGDIECT